jgi:hypothetical protein
MDEKRHEMALRRRAQRRGLVLRRSRARAADDPTRGLYQLGTVSSRGKFHPQTDWLDLRSIEQELIQ